MMRYLVSFLSVLILLPACNDDETPLQGQNYLLVNIAGGVGGVNEDFSNDNIVWAFSEGDDLVITKMTSRLFSGPAEGEYKYEFEGNGSMLRFGPAGDQDAWLSFTTSLTAEGDTLLLDEGSVSDGLIYTLIQQ